MGQLHDALTEAGQRYDLRPIGAFAMNSMRLEKGYRAWGLDLTTERTPLEAGLGFLVRSADRAFIGRDALLARGVQPDAWRMALLELEARDGLDPFTAHSVFQDGTPVGIVTSGAFGHRTGKLLSLAYLLPQACGEDFRVEILGEKVAARPLPVAPYDAENAKLRGHTAATNRLTGAVK